MPSRRPSRPRPSSAAVSATSPCPCGRTAPYGECCRRFHTGQAPAPTAEALMRSRYSAYAVRDAAYLLRTWHPDTRPPGIGFEGAPRWTGLDILETTGGSAFHTEGTVTFRARFTDRGRPGSMHERSRFTRHEGAWVYVDGDVTP
ncbi:YchJ family protein [Streptomyces sp. GC420]|uniref:YchJ family protein n=1 Tax=Streptomyces sp. GC420 TaxID=2697568 RepID=UPI0014150B16|nr:YchJ family protein [Streptomyces sp. GC420]NBM16238.1 hypothetical protein [Streptomyces sp. GC420]